MRRKLRRKQTLGRRPEPIGPAFVLVTVAEDTRFELVRVLPQHAFQACALGR